MDKLQVTYGVDEIKYTVETTLNLSRIWVKFQNDESPHENNKPRPEVFMSRAKQYNAINEAVITKLLEIQDQLNNIDVNLQEVVECL